LPEKRRTAVNQHSAGRRIAGVDLGDGDSFVCVIDGVSGEVVERATIPTCNEAFAAVARELADWCWSLAVMGS
jgi:hypothetical protein